MRFHRSRLTTAAFLVAAFMFAGPLSSAGAQVAELVTIAGTGVSGFSGDGGPAREAQLASPGGLDLDTSGRVLIADEGNHVVRRIGRNGTIATVAGTGGVAGYAGDGATADSALLSGPRDVALRRNRIAFIADTGNHVIRAVGKDGIITTLAGTGTPGFSGDGGPAAAARLSEPSGISSGPNGVVVIADTGNHVIRAVGKDGIITTLGGTGTPGFSGDGGPAATAGLNRPEDVAVLPNGTVYVADTANHRVRRIHHTTGVITTLAGTGTPGFSGDGGPATAAKLKFPTGLEVASDGSVWIADTGNHVIRRIDASGVITTVAGTGQPGYSGDGGPATAAQLRAPRGAAVADGNVLIADSGNHRIRKTLPSLPAPTFTATKPTSPATTTTPRVLGRAEVGSTVTLYTDAACSSRPVATGRAEKFSDPGLRVEVATDSTTTFHATATDAFGRSSICSTSSITYAHFTPPSPPHFTAIPASPGNDRSPTWEFAADGHATACRLLAPDDTVLESWTTCERKWTATLQNRPDGGYVLQVRAIDGAGNTSEAIRSRYTLDTTPPPAPVLTVFPQSPATKRTPSWRFVAEEGASTECRLLGPSGRAVVAWTDCERAWTARLGDAAAGRYVFQVRATDEAGNTGPAAAVVYVLQGSSEPNTLTTGSSRGPTPAVPSGPGGSSHEPSTQRGPGERRTRRADDPRLGSSDIPAASRGTGEAPDRSEAWLDEVGDLVAAHADEAAFPLLLVVVVIAYLMVQDHIDRRDPKLALAPMYDDPELDFVPLTVVRNAGGGRGAAHATELPSDPMPGYGGNQ